MHSGASPNVSKVAVPMPDVPASFTLLGAADRLGLARHQMVQLVEQGQVASHFEGWRRRIGAADLAAYAAARANTAPRLSLQAPSPLRPPSGWPP